MELRVLKTLSELPNQITTKFDHMFSTKHYVEDRSFGSNPPISVHWCRDNFEILASGYLAD
jgi:hypothetical protein